MANVKKKPSHKKIHQPATTRRTTKRSSTTLTQPATVESPAHIHIGAWGQLRESFRMISDHWQYFVIFVIVFAVLNLLLAHNLASGVSATKSNLDSLLGNSAWASVGTYTLVLTSSTTGSSASTAAFQYVLFVIASLAFIWALRQFTAREPKRPTVLESFYAGMAPLIPFVLVLMVLTLCLLPLAGAGTLYGIVLGNGVAAGAVEKILWLLLFFGGAAVTVWLLARLLFSLYIVTLPGSKPAQSLADSFRISKGFQWAIIRKLLLLVLVVLIVGALFIVPIIAFASPLTPAAVFIFSTLLLPFVHTYCYGMYREVLTHE